MDFLAGLFWITYAAAVVGSVAFIAAPILTRTTLRG